jgi:1-acyl-sn-glycerol-3-phosphate acyltransferase
MPEYAWHALRTASRQYLKRNVDLRVEGEGNLPRNGPAIIAARHYHHLIDGAALIATIPHPAHVLVGLDWIRNPALRVTMHALCGAAEWPIIYRRREGSRIDDLTARRALRQAYRESIELLGQGHSLIVFPEGYPTIDPGYTPKTDPDEFLPFQPGFARIAITAARSGIAAPIIPAGFSYEKRDRWQVVLRFGAPIPVDAHDAEAVIANVEQQVHRLSLPEEG